MKNNAPLAINAADYEIAIAVLAVAIKTNYANTAPAEQRAALNDLMEAFLNQKPT